MCVCVPYMHAVHRLQSRQLHEIHLQIKTCIVYSSTNHNIILPGIYNRIYLLLSLSLLPSMAFTMHHCRPWFLDTNRSCMTYGLVDTNRVPSSPHFEHVAACPRYLPSENSPARQQNRYGNAPVFAGKSWNGFRMIDGLRYFHGNLKFPLLK